MATVVSYTARPRRLTQGLLLLAAVIIGVGAYALVGLGRHDELPENLMTVGIGALVLVIALQVAGAFHTRYMAPAAHALQAAVDAIDQVARPTVDLWTNSDGSLVDDGTRALELIVHQVQHPVRWDLCMAGFADRGITGLIEFSPAGALVGLAKRGLRGTPTAALSSPDDLAAARDLLAESAS